MLKMKNIFQNICGISTNEKAVQEFGIDKANMLKFGIGLEVVILFGLPLDFQ